MENTKIAAREHPRRFVGRWPLAKLEGELVSMATHQKSIDGRMQVANPVVFTSVLKRREPIDVSVVRGDIPVETGGHVINDLKHGDEFQTPNEAKLSDGHRERGSLEGKGF